MHIAYTIGDMIVFPAEKINGKPTINVARGFHPRVRDRFDLTLECIRRHYLKEDNPLSATLNRYSFFFGLFDDFAGYVDFFLLQDLVDEARSAVRFLMPFEEFTGTPLPLTVDAYLEYRRYAIDFIEAWNQRIAACAGVHLPP